jgi:nucleotide-binding universal stress UspA family protein
MTVDGPVVCGVEDHGEALEPAGVAAWLADTLGARLLLVHVIRVGPALVGAPLPPPLPEDAPEAPASVQRARALVREVAIACGRPEAEAVVAFGHAADALLSVTERENASLLVTGTRGHGPLRRALLGSVSRRLLRDGGCPAVVVPPGARVTVGGRPPRIVAGLDGSGESLRAVEAAAALARRLRGRITLVHVLEAAGDAGADEEDTVAVAGDAALEGEERQAMRLIERASRTAHGTEGVEVEARVGRGEPATVLAAEASREPADLVAVGSRGLGGLRSAVVGSVSGRLAAGAPVPVLVCPPGAVRAPRA